MLLRKINVFKDNQGVTIRLHEMAPSSLNFVVRVWTTNDAWPMTDLMENFKRALDANNILVFHSTNGCLYASSTKYRDESRISTIVIKNISRATD